MEEVRIELTAPEGMVFSYDAHPLPIALVVGVEAAHDHGQLTLRYEASLLHAFRALKLDFHIEVKRLRVVME